MKNKLFTTLALAFFSSVLVGQDVVLLQDAFNSRINGVTEINETVFAYGFFEKLIVDQGFEDKNLVELGDHLELNFRKITKRPQAELMKIEKLNNGSGYYAWLYHEFCESGPNGNELVFFDTAFNQTADSFFIYQNFDLISESLNDIAQLSNGNWLVSYNDIILYLEPNGRTIRQYKLGFKPESLFKLKENRFFAFSELKLALISLSEVLETNEYGDSIKQVMRYDDEGTLFGVLMKKSFRYVNANGESRVSITARSIGMDHMEAADFINDTTVIIGSSGKLKKQVFLDQNDEVARIRNIAYNLPGEVKYAFLNGDEWVFAMSNKNVAHQRDYLVKWQYRSTARRFYMDLQLDNPQIDSFIVDSSSLNSQGIGNVTLEMSYGVFNNGPDTLRSFNFHLGSGYGENCNFNLLTKSVNLVLRPYSKVRYSVKFNDFDVNIKNIYYLKVAVSSPNNDIDTNALNSAKVLLRKPVSVHEISQKKLSVYPNAIRKGEKIEIQMPNLITGILVYNSVGSEVNFELANSTLQILDNKNGFYLIEANDENGSQYFAKVIVY